jgi:hypothetical protein
MAEIVRLPQEEFDAIMAGEQGSVGPPDYPGPVGELGEPGIPGLTAGATGGNFDLGARDETWDGGAAEKSYDLPADADCYMWKNPDGDPANKSSYKLPFVSKQAGKHAVWGGITAIAGRLSSTQIPAADKKAVQGKVSGYYAKARSKYGDDKIQTPFTVEDARAFLAQHDADFLDDDEVRAYLLLAQYVAEPQAITASLEDIELTAAAAGGTAWAATLCVAGIPTIDSGVKRLLDLDGGSWLPLPLPLGLMDSTPHADVVTKAPVCGRIDQIWTAGNVYQASGVFSDGSDDLDVAAMGAKAVAMVAERLITGISVDLVDTETEMMVYQAGGVGDTEPDADEPMDETDGYQPGEIPIPIDGDEGDEPDGDEDDLEYVVCFTRWTIAGATICPVQALTRATITVLADGDIRPQPWRSETEWRLPALTASAAGLAPLKPPRAWFEDPRFDGPTPVTVTDDGRLYGHLALWGTCHTGRPGACVTPPHSPSGYANFHRGELETEEGDLIPVGVLTMNTGHAGLRLNAATTIAHYDDTGAQAAHVRAGEDAYGIWIAGAVNPLLAAEEVRVLRVAPPSGDWREVNRGEGLDLFAALAVNVQGFPVPRAQARLVAAVEDGEWQPAALVAAGLVTVEALSPEAVQRHLAVLAASADGIEGLAALVS